MKAKLSACLAVLLITAPALLIAEPAAPLLPYNEMGKQMLNAQGKTIKDAAREVPSKADVGLPVYPGSYMGSYAKSGGALSSVQLATRDGPDEVIAWYRKNLSGEWKYQPKLALQQMGEVGVFVKTDQPSMDTMAAMRLQQIRIVRIDKPDDTGFLAMTFDVTSIRAVINMQIKPFM